MGRMDRLLVHSDLLAGQANAHFTTLPSRFIQKKWSVEAKLKYDEARLILTDFTYTIDSLMKSWQF